MWSRSEHGPLIRPKDRLYGTVTTLNENEFSAENKHREDLMFEKCEPYGSYNFAAMELRF